MHRGGPRTQIREGSLGAFLPRALLLLSASADAWGEHEEEGSLWEAEEALLQLPPPVHQGQAK